MTMGTIITTITIVAAAHEHHHDPDDDSARVVRKEGLAYGFADESVLADGFVYDDEI